MINAHTLYQFLTTTAANTVFVSWDKNFLNEYFAQQGWTDFSVRANWNNIPADVQRLYNLWTRHGPVSGDSLGQILRSINPTVTKKTVSYER